MYVRNGHKNILPLFNHNLSKYELIKILPAHVSPYKTVDFVILRMLF